MTLPGLHDREGRKIFFSDVVWHGDLRAYGIVNGGGDGEVVLRIFPDGLRIRAPEAAVSLCHWVYPDWEVVGEVVMEIPLGRNR